jgi:hypothetical protein
MKRDDHRQGDPERTTGPVTLPVVPEVCRKLRTKTAFGTVEGLAHDWREGASSTAVYWCLRTMETWGPDQRVAHARDCRAGRRCYEDSAVGVSLKR